MIRCKYCGKECKNKNSLAQHEIRCKLNPNKIKVVSNFIKYNEDIRLGVKTKEYLNQFVKAIRPEIEKHNKKANVEMQKKMAKHTDKYTK